jgi:hypothetical protein
MPARRGQIVGGRCHPRLMTCTCCGRPWERCPVELKRVGLRGPGRNPDNVCRDCIDHAGFGLRMASEHIALWRSYVDAVEAEGQARLAEAEARVAKAQAELAARPEKVVEKYVNDGEIVAARAEGDRAFRSREYAWRALSALGVLHVELPDDRCRCGKHRRSCAEAALVEGIVGLRAWEARQAAEARAGRTHYLPEGHPALIDHTWQGEAPEEWTGAVPETK